MAEALVKGEQHNSDKDRRELLRINFSEYDAFFGEHHDEPNDGTPNIAAIVYLTSFKLYKKIAKISYHDYSKIRQLCHELGVRFEDNIDLNPYETYNSLSTISKLSILAISLFVAVFSLIVYKLRVEPFLPEILLLKGWYLSDAFATVIFVILIYAMTFGFTEQFGSFKREIHMAEEILSRAEKNDDRSIIVLCGDLHMPVISHILRENGWSVDERPSRTRFSKFFRIYGKFRSIIVIQILSVTR